MIESYEQILESPQYELFVNIIGIFNILCIVVREVDLNDTTNFITVWIYIQFAINFLFLVELLSDMVIHGAIKAYQTHFRMFPETLCQVFNVFALYYFYISG
jgi:hypothetical protein